jgi:hypothetical protein
MVMKQTIINYLFWTVSAVFVAAYFFMVYKFTINIPTDDDFLAIQMFMVKYVQADGIQEKSALLLEGYGLHRLLLMRLVVLSVYGLSGTLNYSIYILIANLFLAGTGMLLYYMIRNKKTTGLLALLTVLLLFNGQNFMNSVWAMSGMANIGSVLVAFLAMYFLLSNSRNSYIGGLLLALLTIYSNGNGMLIIPPIILCLYIQKRMKHLLVFGILSLVAVLLYFYHLNTTRISGDVWNNLHLLVMYFFTFVGCNLWLPSIKAVPFIVGLVCFIVYIWGILKKDYEKDIFCYACLTFLYLSAIAVAVGSLDGSGMRAPLRYRIYGSLFLLLTVFRLIDNAKAFHVKKIIYSFPVFALLFSLFSTAIYGLKMQKILEGKKVSSYQWLNKEGRLADYSCNPDYKFYLRNAERLGLYKMPPYPLSAYKAVIHICEDDERKFSQGEILHKIELIEEKDNFLIIEGWAYFTLASMDFTNISLYLVGKEEQRLVCQPNLERRYDVVSDLDKAECGFFAVIDKAEIPPGTYRIEIGIRKRLSIKSPVLYVATDQTIEI